MKRSLKSYLIILFLFLSLAILYAKYIEPTSFITKEYSIYSENIPSSFNGFTIAHFSDMDLGSTFNIENLDNLVKRINKTNPDIIVFTGDIISEKYNLSVKDKEILINKLNELDPLITKYSVRGNKDNFSDYDEIIERANFKNLNNSYDLIYYKGLTPIIIYGLDSSILKNSDVEKTFSYPSDIDTTEFMATYRILLTHEPDNYDLVKDYNISLFLASHSHNSEINIPYLKDIYHINGAIKYYNPEYEISGTKMYISSGLGTSKLGLRFLSKPSISVYKLYNE